MKLYGSSKTRALRCIWTAEECGFDFFHVPYDPKKKVEYSEADQQILTTGKVPFLVDEDLHLFESAAICHYLAKKSERFDLIGSGHIKVEATIHQWVSFALQELDSYLWQMFLHQKILPDHKRIPEMVPFSQALIKRSLQTIDRHLTKSNSDFLVGDCFTLADLFLSHCLLWVKWLDPELLNDNIKHYLKVVTTRPSFEKAVQYP